MLIEKVVINGLRSYKTETVISNFSTGCTAIVGRNGTGKSNLFDAIGLIFNTKSWTLRNQERRYLLSSDGRNTCGIVGYVEIVLNNESSRFPIASLKVSIKREIRENCDKFIVNNKITSTNEVKHMLETAGFSSRNPYYIVAQGHVNALVVQCPEQQMELLNDVAGLTVYEERSKESGRMLESLDKMEETADELLAAITEKVTELREEAREAKKYHQGQKKLLYVVKYLPLYPQLFSYVFFLVPFVVFLAIYAKAIVKL